MQTKPNTHKLSLIALTVPTWLHHWLVEFHGGSLCHTQSCTRTYNPINVCVLYVVEKRYIYEHTNTFQDSRWIEKENSNVCVLYFANLVSKSSYVMKNRVTLNRGVSFCFCLYLSPIFSAAVNFFPLPPCHARLCLSGQLKILHRPCLRLYSSQIHLLCPPTTALHPPTSHHRKPRRSRPSPFRYRRPPPAARNLPHLLATAAA